MVSTKNNLVPSPDSLARKLSKYSAMTVGGVVGSVACFESSEAALIVTSSGVTLTDTTTGPPPQALINLNPSGAVSDSIPDVRVTVFSASFLTAQGVIGNKLAGTPGAMGTMGTSNFFYPTGFQTASNTVDNTLTFGGASTTPFPKNNFGTLANGSGGTLGPGVGEWFDGTNSVTAYMGVEFTAGGNTHYGWVHITWDPNTDTATIIEYAYQDVPGLGAHIPEPSALALLGLGAMGLAARRRRQPHH